MLEAKEVRKITVDSPVTEYSLEHLITAAQTNHINYVFVDRKLISTELMDLLRIKGYSIVTGQGEVSRIKISW